MSDVERDALRFLLDLTTAALPRLGKHCVTLRVGGNDMRISEVALRLHSLRAQMTQEETDCLR